MKLKCQCCGIEQEFSDGEDAFAKGWDAPPHFTGYVCCNLCPAVCIVLGISHTKAHAEWAKSGRPKDFSINTCATDEAYGNEEKIKDIEESCAILQKTLTKQTEH